MLFAIGTWLWTSRYDIMENYFVEALAERGFEAELDIVSATDTKAKVRDIRLRRDGQAVISVGELRLDYLWPDIREGRFERAELDAVDFTLRLDETWQPADAWLVELLQDNGSNDGGTSFPAKGIAIKDGTLEIVSPLGAATFYADAGIPTADTFTLALTLAPSDLAYRGFAAEGAGVVDVERKGSTLSIDGQVQTDRLANNSLSIRNAHIRADGEIDLDRMAYEGELDVVGETIESEPFEADAMNFGWDGRIVSGDTLMASGEWALIAQGAKLPDPERAKEVAATLSLYPALSVVPVAEHYAGDLTDVIEDFLTGTDLDAKGRLDYGAPGFTITTGSITTLTTETNRLTLTPVPEIPIYIFDRRGQTLQARMDARFDRPVGLTLKDIDLQAASPNGYQLDGITHFSASVTTNKNWRATAGDGRPVRLGPLSTRITYEAGDTRQLSLNTALDYDGPLPGGRVDNLDLAGRIDVRLYDNRQALDFTPRKGIPVTVDRVETPTDWTVTNGRFDLPPTGDIFIRRPSGSTIKTDLQNAAFTLTRPEDGTGPAQRLNISAPTVTLDGLLNPDETQDWTVDFSQAEYRSDTLPGPETLARANQATLTTRLSPNELPQIRLQSPALIAATPLVEIANMAIDLAGTPDAYQVNHSGGRVKLIGTEAAEQLAAAGYASFPADGQVNFANGRFTGEAGLRIAKAGNAPVSVTYAYADGAGEAAISIPSVRFDPKGLQPQQLLPALRGKIARVTGEARGDFQIAFADGALTDSRGRLDLIAMDIATAPGPLTGVNTTLDFNSLWPVRTDGLQTLTMESFNPGYALRDGTMTYRLIPDGVTVESGSWPIGNGRLSLDPFTWLYATEENRVVMRVEDVSLGDFLARLENDKLDATGTVTGEFPIVVRGIQVLVEGGELAVPDGGVIRYNSGLPGRNYSQEEALKVFREKRTNEYAAVARDALKEFNYRELSLKMDGPLDGRIEVGMVFDGSNPKVLNSQPFRFNLNVGGKLINILQSFNSNAQIKSEILNQTGLDIDKVPSTQTSP